MAVATEDLVSWYQDAEYDGTDEGVAWMTGFEDGVDFALTLSGPDKRLSKAGAVCWGASFR